MHEGKLRDILRRLNVVVVEKSSGGWLHAACPFAPWTHRSGRDRRPSFGAKIEAGGLSAYVCFSCHMHGRVSGLVRALQHYGGDVGEVDGNNYPTLAREADAADTEGVVDRPFDALSEEWDPLPEPLDEAAHADIYEEAWSDDSARTYLSGRGVGLPTARAIGLVWDPEQRRVLFPVRDRAGRLYGWTGRVVDPGREPKVRDYVRLPKRHLILGEHRWTAGMGRRPLVIVEGLFAYAHLVGTGVETYADVGALLGSKMTDQKAERIRENDQPTYLLLDNDEAGDAGLFGRMNRDGERDFHAGAVGMLWEHVPIHVPSWPAGKCDPDELTREEVWAILRDTPQYVPPRRVA